MKKRLARILAVTLGAATLLTGCGGNSGQKTSDSSKKSDDQKITEDVTKTEGEIEVWTNLSQEEMNFYVEEFNKIVPGVKVKVTVMPSKEYRTKLQNAFRTGTNAPDVATFEISDLGVYKETDMLENLSQEKYGAEDISKDMIPYVDELSRDKEGDIRGLSWQSTPGGFWYKKALAKEYLGTDDPDKVQEALSSWDKFNSVAEKAAAKGYKMLSGYDDAYRVFSNNVSAPWVDSNNKIVIDDNIMKWVDQTKLFTEKGYNNKSSLWDNVWAADQGPKGKVFGFFYSTWGINFTLLGNSLATPVKEGGKEEVGNGIYGDYAVCQGPQSYYWGGTWICAASGTDNPNLIKEIMKTLTCDKSTEVQITKDTQDYTNTISGMNELASSDFKSAFLGGQNHIKLFAQAAPKINMKNISAYDQGLNEEFQKAMKDYFDGNVTKDKALDNFYKAAIEKYPNLSK